MEIVVGGGFQILCWLVFIFYYLYNACSLQSKHMHKKGSSPPLICAHLNKGCGSNPLVCSPTVYRLLSVYSVALGWFWISDYFKGIL